MRLLIASNVSSDSFTPASLAIAGRCNTVFVEPPSAISTATAFSKAAAVIMSRGQRLAASSAITCIPARFANRNRAAVIAGIVPLPGKPMPRASVRQFIVFAVNIPAQEPQPGQAAISRSHSSSSVNLPALYFPTASNIVLRSMSSPS